ncbi:probable 3-ketoacyl-CoA synthase 20 [Hordeum vulgare subsp. vulgare]|uniref:3-ketoacyl-CoA synthase n=1 Tax=Hordeum vulgare subsp. vulgare TaxID=112509 RepID=A0A8I6WXQ6_HORVV|nr:probable 3-ketoacyl-CoA synthase 20 [Hordeum vulgare subsp. vulgare]
MDNEFEKKVMGNQAKLLYRRLVGQQPHPLAVTLLLAVITMLLSTGGVYALLHGAHGAMAAVSVASAMAAAYVYAWSFRPVYLVNFAAYKPAPAHEATRAQSLHHYRLNGAFNAESMDFKKRILERSGLGDATHFPASLIVVPPDMCLRTANEESHAVVFGVVDDLLAKTRVRPEDIGVVVVNCSLYSPTPSFTSLLVNRYCLPHDVVTHNLSGMGCSAGVIAIDLARRLLQVYHDTYALVVSTENLSLNGYQGNNRPMLVSNVLFRMGGAAVLLSNRRSERRRAKYQLIHTVRTHHGPSDRSYACVTQEEDGMGSLGVSLSKDLTSVAGDALRSNITTLAPLVLPLREQLRFLCSVVLTRVFRAKARSSCIPDFTLALQHLCIHAGGRGVLDELQRSLKLSEWHMEPSRMTLYRFGNTSSSSLWYELAYCEAKGRIKRGDRVWQIAFGSGFKCNSAVWKAVRTVDGAVAVEEGSPWAQDIHLLPVHVPKVMPIDDDASYEL